MITAATRRELSGLLGERVRFDVPMARMTSLRGFDATRSACEAKP